MAPYPRHSSIDSALRSKRPVNRTGPLLHRGFGADRKALPIFLVFHPLAARLAPRSNVLRAIVIACLSSVSPEEHSLIIREVQLFSTSKTMPNILLIKNISFRVESRKIVTRSCSISTTHFMGFGVVHLILPAITRAFYAVYTAGIGFDVQERSTVQYVDSLNMEYVIFS